eukprot:112418-Prorocentrum_minimum.AAC.1
MLSLEEEKAIISAQCYSVPVLRHPIAPSYAPITAVKCDSVSDPNIASTSDSEAIASITYHFRINIPDMKHEKKTTSFLGRLEAVSMTPMETMEYLWHRSHGASETCAIELTFGLLALAGIQQSVRTTTAPRLISKETIKVDTPSALFLVQIALSVVHWCPCDPVE